MRVSTLAPILSATSLASARVIGLSAPAILTPNSTFTLTLLTQPYFQPVSDIAAVWGFQTPTQANPRGAPYTLGHFTNSSYLGPTKSNTLKNVTIEAVVPAELLEGKDQLLSVAVMSTYPPYAGPWTQAWNVTVHVGPGQNNSDLMSSTEVGWDESAICYA
ncbi:hypothetical protein BDU57DRAFT_548330 [Ampelomyces quisqualis]|uniref:Uncharacterized protein n=1 Tax=Ampelomyces quisqualis TaxID=50730 RepID=A0A6A5QMS1_AMPQU|nr:hypothetical protein BDU57DRAFT_548330 [Ampelomyces quisqualis]